MVEGHYNKAISVQMMMVNDSYETVLLEVMCADIVYNCTLGRNWNLTYYIASSKKPNKVVHKTV